MTRKETFDTVREIYARYHVPRLLAGDPLCWVRKFVDAGRETLEVAALIGSSFAYGRVELIQKCLLTIEKTTGGDLNDFCRSTTFRAKQRLFRDFKYRFNDGTDLALLCEAAGRTLAQWGSLEAMALSHPRQAGDGIKGVVTGLTAGLRQSVVDAAGPRKSFDYLLVSPAGGSACKRPNMMLRWLVRPDDGIDLGLWKSVRPSELIIPVDTHIARAARRLKLTARTVQDWRMAEEITASLRRISPGDPVKYDFALCQAGMEDFRKRR